MSDDSVTAWIAALTSRGISLQARGTHIAYSPKSAYNGALTTEERLFAKQHRAAIVAALRAQYRGTARSTVPAAPTTPTAPPPTPCRWCGRTPCIGRDHPAFVDLHPQEALKQEAEQLTKEMYAQLGKPNPWL